MQVIERSFTQGSTTGLECGLDEFVEDIQSLYTFVKVETEGDGERVADGLGLTYKLYIDNTVYIRVGLTISTTYVVPIISVYRESTEVCRLYGPNSTNSGNNIIIYRLCKMATGNVVIKFVSDIPTYITRDIGVNYLSAMIGTCNNLGTGNTEPCILLFGNQASYVSTGINRSNARADTDRVYTLMVADGIMLYSAGAGGNMFTKDLSVADASNPTVPLNLFLPIVDARTPRVCENILRVTHIGSTPSFSNNTYTYNGKIYQGFGRYLVLDE